MGLVLEGSERRFRMIRSTKYLIVFHNCLQINQCILAFYIMIINSRNLNQKMPWYYIFQ